MHPILTRRSFTFLMAASGTTFAVQASASPLQSAPGAPILVISGKIQNSNDGKQAVFDRQLLEGVGMETMVTQTPWYKEPQSFEGVRLARLMKFVGAYGTLVEASALNDYSCELPISDFEQYNTILALKRNGVYMPVSDKGPLFIVYPFDSAPELQNDKFYMRSAWQVSELKVK
jgi:hypothetical protein